MREHDKITIVLIVIEIVIEIYHPFWLSHHFEFFKVKGNEKSNLARRLTIYKIYVQLHIILINDKVGVHQTI